MSLPHRAATLIESEVAVRIYEEADFEQGRIVGFQHLGIRVVVSGPNRANPEFTPCVASLDETGHPYWMIVIGDSYCGTYVSDEDRMTREIIALKLA